MVVIRLSRGGTNKRPFYSILVTDKRKPRDSGYIERLGFYNPIATGGEVKLKINLDKLSRWIKCGAQPSPRVQYLIDQYQAIAESAPSVEKAKGKKKTVAKVAVVEEVAAEETAKDAVVEENVKDTVDVTEEK